MEGRELMDEQRSFHMCQKCHKIVDKIYQKNYCKSCLAESFKAFKPMLDTSHAMSFSSPPAKKEGDR